MRKVVAILICCLSSEANAIEQDMGCFWSKLRSIVPEKSLQAEMLEVLATRKNDIINEHYLPIAILKYRLVSKNIDEKRPCLDFTTGVQIGMSETQDIYSIPNFTCTARLHRQQRTVVEGRSYQLETSSNISVTGSDSVDINVDIVKDFGISGVFTSNRERKIDLSTRTTVSDSRTVTDDRSFEITIPAMTELTVTASTYPITRRRSFVITSLWKPTLIVAKYQPRPPLFKPSRIASMVANVESLAGTDVTRITSVQIVERLGTKDEVDYKERKLSGECPHN